MTTTLDNDLRFVGESTHPGGHFRDIAVMGRVRVDGDVECRSFACMGKAQVQGTLLSGRTSIMGETKVAGAVDAGDFQVMGKVDCESTLRVRKLTCMGRLTVQGRLDAETVKIFGEMNVKGDCNVDEFTSRGAFAIEGLLSVDNLSVQPYSSCRVGEIGGARIDVRRRGGFLANLPGADWVRNNVLGTKGSQLEVQTIEGDDIHLEDTFATVVRGGRVHIGRGCRIETVEYRDDYTRDPDSTVGEARKV